MRAEGQLHGGPLWRAPSPDRGHVEQPGERRASPPSSRPAQQVLIKLERPAAAPPANETEERTEEMAAKKKTRIQRGEQFQKDAVRKVLAAKAAGKSMTAVAEELGVAHSVVGRWVRIHSAELSAPASSKTMVSNGAGRVHPGDAAAVLMDALGKYVRALVDERVGEAVSERMKRLV